MRGMQRAAQKPLRNEVDSLKSALAEQAGRHLLELDQFAAELRKRDVELEKRDAEITRRDVEITRRDAEIAKRDAIIRQLIEDVRLARHRLYGASSEQVPGQGALFDEAEVLTVESPAEDAAAAAVAAGQPRGKRSPLPAHLPRVEIVHELAGAERVCACGTAKVEIGEEVSEQIDIVPMQVRVLRHIRKTCVCPKCQSAPVTAAMPPQPIPKSQASANTLALLLTAKYVDGIPLHRFEKVCARHGFEASRNTLARWVIACSELLIPLHNLLRDHLLSQNVLHMDETPVQVLKEDGRTAQSQSYMWVQSGGPPGEPVVLFDYDPSRSGAVPSRLLEGYRGHLMTDGYEGYNAVVAANGLTHLACWAHARRKFIEAQKAQPKGKTGSADVAVRMIGKLYGIERDNSGLTDIAQRQIVRAERSGAVLNELRTWLDKQLPRVPPKSKLGEALAYLAAYWPKLVRYIERGDLPIDNNRAENAIRPFVIGRKNWLFSDTPAGADASARVYSVIETAKASGHEPYAYLCRLLRELPAAKTVGDVEALLPWKLEPGSLMAASLR